AGGERVPVAVDLGLVGAVDRERDRLAELELGTTVDAGEGLARHRPVDRQDVALVAAGEVSRSATDVVDATVGEDRGVEVRGLFRVLVEPEIGRDRGHGAYLLYSIRRHPGPEVIESGGE